MQANKSLAGAREEFETLNSSLLSDMSSLYERRAEYMNPSIQALIALQVRKLSQPLLVCEPTQLVNLWFQANVWSLFLFNLLAFNFNLSLLYYTIP